MVLVTIPVIGPILASIVGGVIPFVAFIPGMLPALLAPDSLTKRSTTVPTTSHTKISRDNVYSSRMWKLKSLRFHLSLSLPFISKHHHSYLVSSS